MAAVRRLRPGGRRDKESGRGRRRNPGGPGAFDLRKKQDKHPELSAQRLRMAQDAYDYGEALIEPPGLRLQGDRHPALAYYLDEGRWWRHATTTSPHGLLVNTVFADRNKKIRRGALKREGLVVVSAWDKQRWESRPGAE